MCRYFIFQIFFHELLTSHLNLTKASHYNRVGLVWKYQKVRWYNQFSDLNIIELILFSFLDGLNCY